MKLCIHVRPRDDKQGWAVTLSRTEEIRQVASEWEFDKRIPAPRAARLLKELLRRVDDLERGIGQMRLIAGLPLPPDV